MALSDYKPESREIVIGGNSFHVEGLSLDHVAVLIRAHLPDLEALFELFQHAEKITPQSIQAVVTSIVSQAPGFAANVIALASGEADATANAAKLPFAKQIEALSAIGELTFTEVGGVKKALESVAGLLGQMNLTKTVENLSKTMKKGR